MSNALVIFYCDLGATAMLYLKFSNWIYYSIFDNFAKPYQFGLLNIGACFFGDIYCDEKNVIWHPSIVISPFSISYDQVNSKIN